MESKKTFNELGLDTDILAGIADLGFENPTAVQEAVIPRLLTGNRDFVGLAQTGTGKTAAFGLPLIQQTDLSSKDTQVLILCPTRELCLQITRDLTAFARYKKNLHILAVYGGTSIVPQIKSLQKGVQIIVATPGRINDLLRRKKANLTTVRKVVLDEADEMLNMGFQEDLEIILKQVPNSAQTLLFSATMPKQVAAIAGNYMSNPEEITMGKRNAGAENVSHVYYTVHAKDRYLALKRIVDFYPDLYGIIFCRTRVETQSIAEKLMKDGYNADSLHGDLSQMQRDRVMNLFRRKNLQLLVATDVAARGLDVNDLTHIINYNLPDDLELYTHRSGRTGRAGKNGISISIVHMREKGKLKRIQRIIKKNFEARQLPSGQEVCESQLMSLIGRVKNVDVDHDQIDKYMPNIDKMLSSMSREEIIKHFVSQEFNRFLAYYRGAPDLNVKDNGPTRQERPSRRKDRKTQSRTASEGYTRLFINLGRKDRLSAGALKGLIADAGSGRSIETGRISIMNSYSFFEVKKEDTERTITSLRDTDYKKREIRVEPVDESKERAPQKRSARRDPPRRADRPSGYSHPGSSNPGKSRQKKNTSKSFKRKKGKPHRKGGTGHSKKST